MNTGKTKGSKFKAMCKTSMGFAAELGHALIEQECFQCHEVLCEQAFRKPSLYCLQKRCWLQFYYVCFVAQMGS